MTSQDLHKCTQICELMLRVPLPDTHIATHIVVDNAASQQRCCEHARTLSAWTISTCTTRGAGAKRPSLEARILLQHAMSQGQI